MLIDTHAHLNFKAFDKDWKQVIQRAFEKDTRGIINIGSDLKTSYKAVSIAEEYDKGIYAAVSIHPIHVGEIRDFQPEADQSLVGGVEIEKLKKLAQHPKVVAIGETGLDYFHNKNTKEKQKELFVALLNLACRLDLPVIIHSRDAHKDTLEILKTESSKQSAISGVVHCFSGDIKQAQEILNLGFLISFTGNITYPKTESLQEVVKDIPLDKIMVETDCPFLPPQKYRGQRNQPAYVVEIAKKIAEIKEISLGKVADTTTNNAKKLFKLH